MSAEDKKRTAHRALVVGVLEGDGRASRVQRRAAFDNAGLGEPLHTLVNKVAERPTRITDDDINRASQSTPYLEALARVAGSWDGLLAGVRQAGEELMAIVARIEPKHARIAVPAS